MYDEAAMRIHDVATDVCKTLYNVFRKSQHIVPFAVAWKSSTVMSVCDD